MSDFNVTGLIATESQPTNAPLAGSLFPGGVVNIVWREVGLNSSAFIVFIIPPPQTGAAGPVPVWPTQPTKFVSSKLMLLHSGLPCIVGPPFLLLLGLSTPNL